MTTGLIGEGISGDKRVGELERELGLPPGTVRNKDGRDTRSDKKVATIRRELRPKRRRFKRKFRAPAPVLQQGLPPGTQVTTGEGEIGKNKVEQPVTG